MKPTGGKRFLKVARRLFRWGRIALLCLVLSTVLSLIYLHYAGLPGFLATRLRQAFHDQGIELQFTRLRLRWYQGLVVSGLRIGSVKDEMAPRLTADEGSLRFDHTALRHLDFKFEAVQLRDARIDIPLDTNRARASSFTVTNIAASLRLGTNDLWELDQFEAQALGGRLQLSATITNASRLFQNRSTNVNSALARQLWRRELEVLTRHAAQFRFTTPPELRVTFSGDAVRPGRLETRLILSAVGADTPVGKAANLRMSAVARPGTNSVTDEISSRIEVELNGVATEWGGFKAFTAVLNLNHALTNEFRPQGDWQVSIREIGSPYGNLALLDASGDVRPVGTNLVSDFSAATRNVSNAWFSTPDLKVSGSIFHAGNLLKPSEGTLRIAATNVHTLEGDAARLTLLGRVSLREDSVGPAPGIWAYLAPYRISWNGSLEAVEVKGVKAQQFAIAGAWASPKVELSRLHSELYGGVFDLAAELDVLTRELALRGGFNLEPHQVVPLLPEAARPWLEQLKWVAPPVVSFAAAATLPRWTNLPPDWRATLLAGLMANGTLAMADGSFRDYAWSGLQTQFGYTNRQWSLTNLALKRTDGALLASAVYNDTTREYQTQFRSTLDLNPLLALLDESTRDGFKLLKIEKPPVIDGELWGQAGSPARTGVKAKVKLTQLSFRDESAESIEASVLFTNQCLVATNVIVTQNARQATVEGLGLDFDSLRLSFTNVISDLDPMSVTRAIGPQTAEAIEPYKFKTPPHVLMHGSMTLHDNATTDLHFDIKGGPFNYWRFNLPTVAGTAHWVTNQLYITNVTGSFYHGPVRANLQFDFSKNDGAPDYSFTAHTSETDLQAFMRDVVDPTNRMEGTFSSTLVVTHANAADWKSWQGHGEASMRNGYLWDIPIFGAFTPALNAVSSGMGSIRASAAHGTAIITNSVVRTRDLEIKTPMLRLAYDGTVDFDGKVDAEVEAEMLRDTWLVGKLFSLAFAPLTKLFVYKVSNTLMDPKMEPLYVPKFMLAPLHPIKTIKKLLPGSAAPPEEPKKTPTPAESVKP